MSHRMSVVTHSGNIPHQSGLTVKRLSWMGATRSETVLVSYEDTVEAKARAKARMQRAKVLEDVRAQLDSIRNLTAGAPSTASLGKGASDVAALLRGGRVKGPELLVSYLDGTAHERHELEAYNAHVHAKMSELYHNAQRVQAGGDTTTSTQRDPAEMARLEADHAAALQALRERHQSEDEDLRSQIETHGLPEDEARPYWEELRAQQQGQIDDLGRQRQEAEERVAIVTVEAANLPVPTVELPMPEEFPLPPVAEGSGVAASNAASARTWRDVIGGRGVKGYNARASVCAAELMGQPLYEGKDFGFDFVPAGEVSTMPTPEE
jgi:hypothetical protein